jgi:hypothetical protein
MTLRTSNRIHRWRLKLVKQALIGDAFRCIPAAQCKPEPFTWPVDAVTLSWLGHSTILINFCGVTILTDPVLGCRIGPGIGPFVLGPKRLVRPR